ncbi:beta-glucan synthesis-associated [Schizophyllum amplum]|uniref:Beta-glucan synthesis-associated n=1 Tax=Schizophyllum amplum TaxID=97359 RepID=A0A550CJ25_9AGAR|nr:beta-glucan synthesis-associated [Auriculariopsis ampla]
MSTYYQESRHRELTAVQYDLHADPLAWGASNIMRGHREADDVIHNPDPRRDRMVDRGSTIFTLRGVSNLGFLALLLLGLCGLFAGYPIASYFTGLQYSNNGGFSLGGINGTGQVPEMSGNWGMIDRDTPEDVRIKKAYLDGRHMQLIFSDEFNLDDRTFYPGDDPYWEAVELHYWGTVNKEWYDPKAITTKDGALRITLTKEENHNLNYTGGMMQTWNKFCFTGGLIEAAVTLPGANDVLGLWPAVWAMGNLGRAGYGASLDGTWPYTYDSCDVGTVANQTVNGQPHLATVNGDDKFGGVLSYMPGQRLSRCTCPGEIHPGPIHSDGTYVGRATPEIDVFEAQVDATLGGHVSQSGQWAPFNYGYEWLSTDDNMIIYDHNISSLNTYTGGVYQQASSIVSKTNQACYELEEGCFSTYGFEYRPGFDNGYITWISDAKRVWTMKSQGMAADPKVDIGARPVPQEPMYLIINLGISENFGTVDYDHLTFPTTMSIDYIRVYQDINDVNYGCDPDDFPTKDYIKQFEEAYKNPNLTTWTDDYKQTFPKNSFLGEC